LLSTLPHASDTSINKSKNEVFYADRLNNSLAAQFHILRWYHYPKPGIIDKLPLLKYDYFLAKYFITTYYPPNILTFKEMLIARDKLEEFAPIFYPKSQAVIGASADTRKFGGRLLKVLLSSGYRRKTYPVNPNESQILGLRTYSRVGGIPEPVNFTTITVPTKTVPEITEECSAKGIKAVQIPTADFRERNEEDCQVEEQLTETAAKGISSSDSATRVYELV